MYYSTVNIQIKLIVAVVHQHHCLYARVNLSMSWSNRRLDVVQSHYCIIKSESMPRMPQMSWEVLRRKS